MVNLHTTLCIYRYVTSSPPLQLKFFALKNLILPFPLLLECIRAAQRILHELHVRDQPVLDLAPDTEWARACLSQRPAPVSELPEDGYILPSTEEGLHLEGFVGPDGIHSREGIDDGLRARGFMGAGVREDGG